MVDGLVKRSHCLCARWVSEWVMDWETLTGQSVQQMSYRPWLTSLFDTWAVFFKQNKESLAPSEHADWSSCWDSECPWSWGNICKLCSMLFNMDIGKNPPWLFPINKTLINMTTLFSSILNSPFKKSSLFNKSTFKFHTSVSGLSQGGYQKVLFLIKLTPSGIFNNQDLNFWLWNIGKWLKCILHYGP